MSTATRRLFEEVSPDAPASVPAPPLALARTEDTLRPQPPVTPAPVPAAPASRIADWLRLHAVQGLLAACSLLGVVLFWHLATTYRWDFYIRFTNIPTPMDVLDKVVQVNANGKFITNIGMSLRRIVIGFGVATVLGVAMGLLGLLCSGLIRVVGKAVMPWLGYSAPAGGAR